MDEFREQVVKLSDAPIKTVISDENSVIAIVGGQVSQIPMTSFPAITQEQIDAIADIPNKVDKVSTRGIVDLPYISMTFTDLEFIDGVDVPMPSTISDWNTFFETDKIVEQVIADHTITLYASGLFEMPEELFDDNTNLINSNINCITTIGKSVYFFCNNISTIIIGNSVTAIGSDAFNNCIDLETIIIGNSVTTIGASCFDGCANLTTITLPNSVIELGDGAFTGCENLATLTAPSRFKGNTEIQYLIDEYGTEVTWVDINPDKQDALGISAEGSATKFLNEQGDFVAGGGGISGVQVNAVDLVPDVDNKVNVVVPTTPSDIGAIPTTQNALTKEPTGFVSPELVIINYDPTAQTITLTGTITAYYQGTNIAIANPTFVSGWASAGHPNVTGHIYFLYYNGTNFVWGDNAFPGFDKVLIAVVNYGATNKYAVRECHGFMPWQDHKQFHETMGTYKTEGGTFPSNKFVLSSTTAGDRRPDITETKITDEDCPTTLAALTSKEYTVYNLTGAAVGAYTLANAEIVLKTGNNPYYNSFSTPNWGNTTMPSNSVATIWVYGIPVTASAGSQAYRYLFVQPQWVTLAGGASAGQITTAINTEALRLPSELNLGTLTLETPELVCLGKIIIAYTSSNWSLRAVTILTGSKYSQIGSPSGNYLSTVTTDTTLTGDGTGGSPLSVNMAMNILTAAVGAESYTLIRNKPTNILDALPSGVNSTLVLPSPTAGETNESVLHFSTGGTAPTLVYSSFTPVWLNGVALQMKINKTYTIVFEQVRTATSTWIVKASWGEY